MNLIIRSALLSALLSVCVFGGLQVLRASELYYPPVAGAWEGTDPSELGFDPSLRQALLTFLEQNNSRSFLLIHQGRVVMEHYWAGHDADAPWPLWSASKTVLALMIGHLQESGRLDLDEPVSNHLGLGWSQLPAQQEQHISIRHLATMTSGLSSDGQFLFPVESNWLYNHVYEQLPLAVAAASAEVGTPVAQLNGLAGRLVFNPIGMPTARWFAVQHQGRTHRALTATARETGRFGLLLLRRGYWPTVSLAVSRQWYDDMLRPSQAYNPAYGILTWLNGQSHFMVPLSLQQNSGPLIPSAPSDCFAAMGANEQRIYIVPSHDLVIVRQGLASLGGGGLAAGGFDEQLWQRLKPLTDPLGRFVRRVSLNTTQSWTVDTGAPADGSAGVQVFSNLDSARAHVFQPLSQANDG